MNPEIRQYMVSRPRVVEAGMSVIQAFSIMKDTGYHHLPVVEHGTLVGIISDRDILGALTPLPKEIPSVQDTMSREPLSVSQETPLRETLVQMAARNEHCAVIRDQAERVVGIFTARDALIVLAAFLKWQESEGEAAAEFSSR
ncbi:MAG: CBS domain-containing protein [Oligoflexia bacterium]|nr:CBS domain-containing protein [Oligoflexia bacterium]